MLTPSLVMVGAPHFFSRTTLRPLGPSVTLTASASWFIPRSSPRRASSLNAISLAMFSPRFLLGVGTAGGCRLAARDGRSRLPGGPFPPTLLTSAPRSYVLSLSTRECQRHV